MTEMEMVQELEKARKFSQEIQETVWALSNGSNIRYTISEDAKEVWKNLGYWVCSIFEYGYRAEA